MSAKAAQARGWIKEKGKGVFTRTADTQYYVWRDGDGELVAYQFHNKRTGQVSPVICNVQKARRLAHA